MENTFISERDTRDTEVSEWLQEFRNELKLKTYRKSQKYNFDF